LHEAEDEAAIALIDTKPATLAGATELMRYVVMRKQRGDCWPDGLVEEGSTSKWGKPWESFLHRNLVEFLATQAA
jgi:hypothetical protein